MKKLELQKKYKIATKIIADAAHKAATEVVRKKADLISADKALELINKKLAESSDRSRANFSKLEETAAINAGEAKHALIIAEKEETEAYGLWVSFNRAHYYKAGEKARKGIKKFLG